MSAHIMSADAGSEERSMHIRPLRLRAMEIDYYAWALKMQVFTNLFETGSTFYLDLITVKGAGQTDDAKTHG